MTSHTDTGAAEVNTDRALSEMNGIGKLDAFVLNRGSMVKRAPYTFTFGGVDYLATCGARDTMRSLTEGGFHDDTEFTALVDASQFGTSSQPSENEKVTVCLDGNGVPCLASETVAQRLEVRIKQITRAGGGLTYTFRTATRG